MAGVLDKAQFGQYGIVHSMQVRLRLGFRVGYWKLVAGYVGIHTEADQRQGLSWSEDCTTPSRAVHVHFQKLLTRCSSSLGPFPMGFCKSACGR